MQRNMQSHIISLDIMKFQAKMQRNIQSHIISLDIIKFQANALRFVVADAMSLFFSPPKLFATSIKEIVSI